MICSVLLFVAAAVDIVLLTSLPFHDALNDALPYIRPLRNSNLPAEDLQALARLPEYITKSLTMYWNIWVAVSAVRFALYGALSFYIYQARGSYMVASYAAKTAPTGLAQLKSRVVFTFAFMEMMVWFWVCLFFFFSFLDFRARSAMGTLAYFDDFSQRGKKTNSMVTGIFHLPRGTSAATV